MPSYDIVFFYESGYVLCVTDGSVNSADEYISWGLEVTAKAKEAGCTRFLFDNRTFSLNLSPLDIVLFAKKYEELNMAQFGFRMAVLSNPKNPEVSRLVETTLINRSASYKRFNTQAEALTWLLKN